MKTFIEVIASHDCNGKIRPLSLKWKDGRTYRIDRILDVRSAAALKAGGQGLRYICRIQSKEVALFLDDGVWFIDH